MNNVLGILLLSIVLLVYIFEIIQKKRKRLKKKRIIEGLYPFEIIQKKRKRLKKKRIIEGLYPNVLKAKNTFENHTSFKSGYFNNNKLDSWKTSYILLKKELNRYKIETLKLENIIVVDIKKLFNYFENGNTIRDEYNKEFVAHELKECNALFSNIEGQSLDEQQRLAVIKDEDNNLVIAGAGSGKTTTVAGKVAYVINRFKIQPEEILLITFTKKASDEMKHRIKKKKEY